MSPTGHGSWMSRLPFRDYVEPVTTGPQPLQSRAWLSVARPVRRRAGLGAVLATALLTPFAGMVPASAAPAGTSSPAGSYVVRATTGGLGLATAGVARTGGQVERRLDIINGLSARLPAGAAARLRSTPGVLSVTGNAAVRLLSSDTEVDSPDTQAYSPATDSYSLAAQEATAGVRQAWARGYTGQGIDVAVLDSGVSPVDGLATPGKVVLGPDLTPESQDPATRQLDTFGHGTHMAGIIAGRDTAAADETGSALVDDATNFLGVAPDARVVSVKAADRHGSTDVSQVIAGIDWVVQHAHDDGRNIRVLNLSFGTNAAQSYLIDPLAYAAEQAWLHGIVVVTSAGNSGSLDGRLTDPAIDPMVLAVGADETNGTADTSDDSIPSFSSTGTLSRRPDLVAPGTHVQSLRSPGSEIDIKHGASGKLGNRFFRGSGTSQAAAFTSGAAALLLSQRPDATPDEIKALLRNSSTRLLEVRSRAQGRGVLSVSRAIGLRLPDSATQLAVRSTGSGTLEGSRGSLHLVSNGVTLSGEQDIFGQPFNADAMAVLEAQAGAWTGGRWNSSAWAGDSWTSSAWASSAWSSSAWASSAWAGGDWSSSAWASSAWSSSAWASSAWSSSAWSDSSWGDASWD